MKYRLIVPVPGEIFFQNLNSDYIDDIYQNRQPEH